MCEYWNKWQKYFVYSVQNIYNIIYVHHSTTNPCPPSHVTTKNLNITSLATRQSENPAVLHNLRLHATPRRKKHTCRSWNRALILCSVLHKSGQPTCSPFISPKPLLSYATYPASVPGRKARATSHPLLLSDCWKVGPAWLLGPTDFSE